MGAPVGISSNSVRLMTDLCPVVGEAGKGGGTGNEVLRRIQHDVRFPCTGSADKFALVEVGRVCGTGSNLWQNVDYVVVRRG